MKVLSLKLPDALDAKLTATAKRRAASKSAIVRDAIEQMLSNGRRPQSGSALDLARDLAGCVSGPRDLSVNKRHLAGYGS